MPGTFAGPIPVAERRANTPESSCTRPGLVCLHGDDGFDVDGQLDAFGVALDEITALPGGDPTNLLIEVTWQSDVDGGMLVKFRLTS